MSMQDWDYVTSGHPGACCCEECTDEGPSKMPEETPEAHSPDEPGPGEISAGEVIDSGGDRTGSGCRPPIPNWTRVLLMIAAVSIAGVVASVFVESYVPFCLLLGFSVFYCVERWSGYYTWKHKSVGKVYRLVLNLSLLSLLGLLTWSGVLLFTQRFMQSPLVGSILFVFEFAVFVWLCRVASRNSWRQPSMKLTVFSVIGVFLIFAFAGVQPLSAYKDSVVNSVYTYFTNANQRDTTPLPSDTTPAPSDTACSPSGGINSHTGRYENYYLGLVDTQEGYLSGNGCYDDWGDFIVLINNENAVEPSYSQLVSFLQQDSTDQFPYVYAVSPPGMYYGSAESHVDLERIQNIIDGTAQPADPRMCGDFAERLHNNAETAGIRCAYVSVTLAGSAGHACDAFQTTDRGLVYVDVTGWVVGEPHPDRAVSMVSIVIGQSYRPVSLFHEAGWQGSYVSMGTVIDFQVVWDGTWNN
jgi:hypothetical protein